MKIWSVLVLTYYNLYARKIFPVNIFVSWEWFLFLNITKCTIKIIATDNSYIVQKNIKQTSLASINLEGNYIKKENFYSFTVIIQFNELEDKQSCRYLIYIFLLSHITWWWRFIIFLRFFTFFIICLLYTSDAADE